jgi:hypothetical protein
LAFRRATFSGPVHRDEIASDDDLAIGISNRIRHSTFTVITERIHGLVIVSGANAGSSAFDSRTIPWQMPGETAAGAGYHAVGV